MANATSETVVTVEGPKGKAEVVEVIGAQTGQPEYRVLFQGTVETFKSMGEAYITAKERVDYKG